MVPRGLFICAFLLFLYNACSPRLSERARIAHQEEIRSWREARLAELRGPFGWPTLIGLFWLREGQNTVGSARGNDIRFPSPMPDRIGNFYLAGDSVTYDLDAGLQVTCNGQPAHTGTFKTDVDDSTTFLFWESFQWHIIRRGEKFGVRLKDTLHPERMQLATIPGYPVRAKWKKKARFIEARAEDKVSMRNQVDMTLSYPAAGYLEFRHNGKLHRLAALDHGPEWLFVIIADKTTGIETYGGGRYLYVPRPDPNNDLAELDFNKAQNPPCVFTDFATCLLPPGENILPFKVKAGERVYGGH